jgi:hypothetical protein
LKRSLIQKPERPSNFVRSANNSDVGKSEFRKDQFFGGGDCGLLLNSIYRHAVEVIHSKIFRKVRSPIHGFLNDRRVSDKP